jgi:hypothetical protein
MSETELQEKLKQINEAMEKAKNDPARERTFLDAIVDPADATACEGCQ